MDRVLGPGIKLVGVVSIVALALVPWLSQGLRFPWTIARGRAVGIEASERIDGPDESSGDDGDIP